jgi:hypothetical protein
VERLAASEDEEVVPLPDAPSARSERQAPQKAWRSEVPWLQSLVPDPLPLGIYSQILRQPRKSTYIGYYRPHNSIPREFPRGFKQQSKSAKFGMKAGSEVTEHQAAIIAVDFIWAKHLTLVPEKIPQRVLSFCDTECAGCKDGTCHVLKRMQEDWEASHNRHMDGADVASNPEGSETSSDSSSEGDSSVASD